MSTVAVLKGGSSLERQVSLRSGARVEEPPIVDDNVLRLPKRSARSRRAEGS